MENRHCDRVFVDGEYVHGGMRKEDIFEAIKEYRKHAVEVQKKSGASHVVFAYREYDFDGNLTLTRLYSGLEMTDEEFHKAVNIESGDFRVDAIHARI